MANLRLISLVCNATEDNTGADETYLHVEGKRVWGPTSMNDTESKDLKEVPLIPFRYRVRIDLYDQDAGGWFDKDDHLGTTYVSADQADAGEKEHTFTGDGANYRLTYEVYEVLQ